MRALEDWAWKQPIPWKHKGVLVALARAYNREDGCFAGQPAIGELMGVSERKVRESEKWLTESGFIRRRRRHRANGSHTSDEVSFSSPVQAAISAASLPAESAASAGGSTGRICQSYRQNLPHHKREVEKGRGSNGSSYVAGSFNPDLDLGGDARPREGTSADVVETNFSNDNSTPTLLEEDTSSNGSVELQVHGPAGGGGAGRVETNLSKEQPAWVSAAFAEYPQLVGADLARTASDQRLGGEGELRQRRAILVEMLKDRLGYRDAHRRANVTPEDDLPTLPAYLEHAA